MVTPQSGTLGALTLIASTPASSFGQQMVFFAALAQPGNAPPGGSLHSWMVLRLSAGEIGT
jgi:hypothetical protein